MRSRHGPPPIASSTMYRPWVGTAMARSMANISSAGAEPVRRNQEVFDDASGDEMLLDDPLEDRWVAGSVPRALGVDDCYRSSLADPEAIRFRAKDAALLGQPELLEPPLEKFPRREAAILLAALRRRLIAAEENVAPRDGYADRIGGTPLRIGDHHARFRLSRQLLPDPISVRARSAAPYIRRARMPRRPPGSQDSLRRPNPSRSARSD